MQKVDIRPLKQRLRNEIKAWRRSLTPEEKQDADGRILERVLKLREYESCKTILTYISLPIEVDTLKLIESALADGKRVAAPRCIEGTREMEFYVIRSFDDLSPQTFGVLEPVPQRCEKLRDVSDSICIVPALAYDLLGYRLGYGAGYYDRFLSAYALPKIGLIYAHNLQRRLWSGRFDVPVDLIVTEKRLLTCTADKRKYKEKRK